MTHLTDDLQQSIAAAFDGGTVSVTQYYLGYYVLLGMDNDFYGVEISQTDIARNYDTAVHHAVEKLAIDMLTQAAKSKIKNFEIEVKFTKKPIALTSLPTVKL